MNEGQFESFIYAKAKRENKDISQVYEDRIVIAEICERFKEVEPNNCFTLIALLNDIGQESLPAMFLLIDFLSGDAELMRGSYADVSKRFNKIYGGGGSNARGRPAKGVELKSLSRQAIHQRTQKHIRVIEKHNPRLGSQIREILKACHKGTKGGSK